MKKPCARHITCIRYPDLSERVNPTPTHIRPVALRRHKTRRARHIQTFIHINTERRAGRTMDICMVSVVLSAVRCRPDDERSLLGMPPFYSPWPLGFDLVLAPGTGDSSGCEVKQDTTARQGSRSPHLTSHTPSFYQARNSLRFE